MNKYILSLLLLITHVSFAQHTEIQFPRLNYQMNMNQELRPANTYFIQNDVIVGDNSGIIFSTAVEGKDINLANDLSGLVSLNSMKFTIAPTTSFRFHAFYGRYKFLAEDFVLPNGMQHNFAPNANLYGIMPIYGSGLAISTPIEYGKYEPEVILFSSSYNGVDYLNLFLFSTFRFEKLEFQLYSGVSIPTLSASSVSVKGSGGFMIYTVLDYVNVYFTMYVSPYYGEEFSMDDVYIRLSQHVLVGLFEQSFSFTSLGAVEGNLTDPLIGLGGVPDMNVYLSLGARIHNIGVGFEYGFIYGLYQSEALIENLNHISNRLGLYTDIQYLGLTYRAGVFYSLPGSDAYIKSNSSAGEVGLYVSVYGRA